MKTIIDENTGEVLETENENEIAERKLYEVGAIDEETYDFLVMFKANEDRYKRVRYAILKAMSENNIKKWIADDFTIIYKSGGKRKTIDIEKLKKDGLYDRYVKEVDYKESIDIRFE